MGRLPPKLLLSDPAGLETLLPAASPLVLSPFILLILIADLADGNRLGQRESSDDHVSSYVPLRIEDPLRFATRLVRNAASLATPPIRADVTP